MKTPAAVIGIALLLLSTGPRAQTPPRASEKVQPAGASSKQAPKPGPSAPKSGEPTSLTLDERKQVMRDEAVRSKTADAAQHQTV